MAPRFVPKAKEAAGGEDEARDAAPLPSGGPQEKRVTDGGAEEPQTLSGKTQDSGRWGKTEADDEAGSGEENDPLNWQ